MPFIEFKAGEEGDECHIQSDDVCSIRKSLESPNMAVILTQDGKETTVQGTPWQVRAMLLEKGATA